MSRLRRIAIVFDDPYEDWGHDEHAARMADEIDAWKRVEPEQEYQIGYALGEWGYEFRFVGMRDDPTGFVEELVDYTPDLVFNVAEQFAGRDALEYVVPSLAEAAGFNVSGTPARGLLLTRDKGLSKQLLSAAGVRVPRFEVFHRGEKLRKTSLSFPAIVKPLDTDASVGISRKSVVTTSSQAKKRVRWIHESIGADAIVEEFVDGRELYMTVLEVDGALRVLPPCELVFDTAKSTPLQRIATKKAKWREDYRARMGIRNIIARPLARTVRAELDRFARTAFRALGLRDYARLDVRLDATGAAYVLEVNANPYLAYGHEVSRSAEAAGMEYEELIAVIAKAAWRRGR